MYSREEVVQHSLKYFNDDELAAETFLKYSLQNREKQYLEPTPDHMFRNRLTPEFARMESKFGGSRALSEEQIYNYIAGFKYIVPQGSPLAGIGNNYKLLSLSNCVVIPSPEDNISSIVDTAKRQANLFKRRAGVGTDISPLRPEGTLVNNAAGTTTGAWSFADFYSYVCRMIGQAGRRGALMLTMSCKHPDIFQFASMKADDKKVTGANVSVRILDEFMQAVENDDEYTLMWPCDSLDPSITQKIKARDLWDHIIYYATTTADPGLLFWDNIINNLPAQCYPGFETICTNPCQPADATLLTPNGIRTMGEIKIGDTIWSGKRWTKVVNKWSTGIKDVYEYKTNAGVFLGTQNHRVVSNGIKTEVQHAKSIDVCRVHDPAAEWDNAHFEYQSDNVSINIMDGLVLGDGSVHKASNNLVGLHIGQNDQDYLESIEIKDLILEHKPGIKDTFYIIKTTITDNELVHTYNRDIPDRYFRADPDTQMAFLRGLYSANGSVVDKRVTLKAASLQLVRKVQQMLSGLGIRSYLTTNQSKPVTFANGTYKCKTSYDLNISTDRNIFAKNIGFIQQYKTTKLNEILDTKPGHTKTTYDINGIKYRSTEEVFDITVEDEEHTYWTGGLLVSNCGEVPLSSGDSCRLISICLRHLIENPFTSKTQFNYDLFQEVVSSGQRLSDDLVELEIEKLTEIINVSDTEDERELFSHLLDRAEKGRRTGLGTHGLADALAQLCLPYDSDEALEVIDNIYRVFKETSYAESVELAKERGAFPVWDWELEKDNNFIKSLPEWLRKDIQQHGRRNISNMTMAPTGSIAIESQTTGGGEPLFRVTYNRSKKRNHDDTPEDTDIIDNVGDRWVSYEVHHPLFKEWLELSPDHTEDNIPDFFRTSEQIDWDRRVDIQGTIQKHIDHSISSTINLPRGTSTDVVGRLYMRAWKSGLKGVTIYVEGSKDHAVLTSNDEANQDSFVYKKAHTRPDILECDIHTVSVKGQKWTIIVGLIDDKPYEVFGGLSEAIQLPTKVKAGYVIKRNYKTKPSEYDLDLGDGFIIKNIAHVFNNDLYPVHTRMVSLGLRHGAQPSFVAEQLLKDSDSDLTSFSKVLARVLKKYIDDGVEVESSNRCPQCESNTLIYQEGCPLCLSCGFTKCG